MQKLKVAVVLKVFILVLVFFLQDTLEVKALSSDVVGSLVAIQSVYQKVIAQKSGQESQEQMLAQLHDVLEKKLEISEDAHNGLTTLGLKNKEEYIWFFLGVATMLGIALVVKVVMMLANNTEEKDRVSLPAPENVGSSPTNRGTVSAPGAGGGTVGQQPAGGHRQAEQQHEPPVHVQHGHVQLDIDGEQIRLTIDNRPAGHGVQVPPRAPAGE